MLPWLAILLLSPARAQPLEVVTGADLVAWRGLTERRLDEREAIGALRAFVITYPTSPLAEQALDRLAELGVTELDWVPEALRPEIERVAASRAQHQQQLEHTPTTTGVARLTPSGEPIGRRPPRWQLDLHAGGGWQFGPTGIVGLRVGRGPLSGVVRAGWIADGPAAELALRVGAWNQRFFAEVGLHTGAALTGRIGAAIPLTGPLSLELGAGAVFDWGKGLMGPEGRAELCVRL